VLHLGGAFAGIWLGRGFVIVVAGQMGEVNDMRAAGVDRLVDVVGLAAAGWIAGVVGLAGVSGLTSRLADVGGIDVVGLAVCRLVVGGPVVCGFVVCGFRCLWVRCL
jgi:hypothetical protein